MKSVCFLSPAAENDVDEVVSYLAKENLNAANLFLDSLFEAFEKLADNPEMGHLREDLTGKEVRFWTFKWHYLIIYKSTSPIEIVRVFSGFRDIANLIGTMVVHDATFEEYKVSNF